MNSTAVRARLKMLHMIFAGRKPKDFYYEKLEETRNGKYYCRRIFYIRGTQSYTAGFLIKEMEEMKRVKNSADGNKE